MLKLTTGDLKRNVKRRCVKTKINSAEGMEGLNKNVLFL
jgi:hypothetical protein